MRIFSPPTRFSDINPATEENPITAISLSLSLVAFGQPTSVFQDAVTLIKRPGAADSDGSSSSYVENLGLLSLPPSVYKLPESRARTDSATTQLVQFSNFSSQQWLVTPPGRRRLVAELSSGNKAKEFGAWQFAFEAQRLAPPASTELSWGGVNEDLYLTQEDAAKLVLVRFF